MVAAVEELARVERIELFWLDLHRTQVHRAAYGEESDRPLIVVRVTTDVGEGWGECAALSSPAYRPEFAESSWIVLHRYLAPRLVGSKVPLAPVVATSRQVQSQLDTVSGFQMAKAALEMAVLDAVLCCTRRSLAADLGVEVASVPAGAVVGLSADPVRTVEAVQQAVAAGFGRVRVKIAPGQDRDVLGGIRRQFPTLALQADANGAYDRGDISALTALDDLDLVCLEQPFAADDLMGHVALAAALDTPIALDESVSHPGDVAVIGTLGAARVLCLKPACLGGIGPTVDAHRQAGRFKLQLWCGGMLQSGLGRAVDATIAGLAGFVLPGDFGGAGRPFVEDDPFGPVPLSGGRVTVHGGPGVGPRPDLDALFQVVGRHVAVDTKDR